MQARFEDWAEAEERLRLSLLGNFRAQPQLALQEEILHGPLDWGDAEKVRKALMLALKAEPTIGDAERTALQPFGPEQWQEAQTRVQSHLESPTAIPEQDLAVYVPLDMEPEPRVRQPLEDQVDEVARLAREALADESDTEEINLEELEEAIEEKRRLQRSLPQELDKPEPIVEKQHEAEPEPTIEADIVATPGPDALAALLMARDEPEVLEPLPTVDLSDWDLAEAMDPSRLTPLPLVAAALEAVGFDEDQFGFLLRYGTLAPVGRKSEIKITGLGMAEFSRRAADWFNALGTSKFPIQVVDDGSGHLTVYLLESVPA
jgi:hypothetical protein